GKTNSWMVVSSPPRSGRLPRARRNGGARDSLVGYRTSTGRDLIGTCGDSGRRATSLPRARLNGTPNDPSRTRILVRQTRKRKKDNSVWRRVRIIGKRRSW